MSPAHNVISLYTGAGGLDLGLEAAGFTTTVAVEYNAVACQTLRANATTRGWSVLEADIHSLASREIAKAGGVRVGEAAMLVGGPPCQPFSKSAYWVHGDTRRLDDPRADTLSAYLRVLRDLQPKAFLLENVFGLTYRGKDEALDLLRRTVDRINKRVGTHYSFQWAVLNCADYGVPQMRERFFLIGARDGREFKFPAPTHFDPAPAERSATREGRNGAKATMPHPSLFLVDDLARGCSPWRTAWDALGDLDEPVNQGLHVTGRWAELLPSIPEGHNYLWHTDRGGGVPLFGWRRRYWSFLLKLAKSRPSWTVQAQPGAGIGPFHWANRRLSLAEMMRLQTFPDGYKVVGGSTEGQRQLGNAVPSLVTEILGRAIREQFLDDPVDGMQLKLLPPQRLPLPPPEPVAEVPARFRQLAGLHAAHPGTGKGHLVHGR